MKYSRGSMLAATAGLAALPYAARAAVDTSDAPQSITIAYVAGIGYANIVVIKQLGLIEKSFPNTKVNWIVLGTGTAIREAVIAKQVQIGCNSPAPFLIGWDRGVGYKLMSAMSSMDLWMMAKDPAIKTVKDIKPGMQIGVAGVDSIQATATRKAAAQFLGDAKALDGNIVAIDHPTGMQALLNGQIAVHFTSPPFQYQEQAAGCHIVLKSSQVFGNMTFINVFSTQEFYDAHPKFCDRIYRIVLDTAQFLKESPAKAAVLLAKDAGGNVPAASFQAWIERPDVTFGTTPRGYTNLAIFMKQLGQLTKIPSSMHEIELPNLGGAGN